MKTKKKLTLARETLRTLEDRQMMTRVAGASGCPTCDPSCCGSCFTCYDSCYGSCGTCEASCPCI
jgi:hypothetical protein